MWRGVGTEVSVIRNNELPVHKVPRIRTRVLVDGSRGAASTAIWEQWIDLGGHIPVHYHDTEEVLVINSGSIELFLAGETRIFHEPLTIVVPSGILHGLKPASDEQVHLLAMFPTADPVIFAEDGSRRPMPWEDRDA